MMLYMDAFGVNSYANMILGGRWNADIGGQMSITSGAGPFGENCLSYNSNGTAGYTRKVLSANQTTLHWGAWVQITALGSKIDLVGFYDGATCQVYVEVGATGQLSFYSGTPGSGTLLATSVSATLSLNTWTFVEVGIVFNSATGSVEMKFNGADVISLTGSLNTAPSGNNQANQLAVGHLFSFSLFISLAFNLTNMYLCNASGTYNSTFLGPGQVLTRPPTANGTDAQFAGTPNTGSNTYENVNSNPPSPSSYNYSSTAGNKDTFTKAAIPGTVSSILAMQVSAFCTLDAAGARTAQLVLLSSSTEADLPASPLSVSPGYSTILAIEEVDPHTSLPITVTAFNAIEFGYLLTT